MRYPMTMYRHDAVSCEDCQVLNEEQERGLVTFGFSMDPGHGGFEVTHVHRQYEDIMAEELGDPTPIEVQPEPDVAIALHADGTSTDLTEAWNAPEASAGEVVDTGGGA